MDHKEIEEIKKYIKEMNEFHLEEEALLAKELGGFGVGSGFELGNIPHPIRAEKKEEYKQLYLADSIKHLWSDAAICYVKRRFRACVILLACLIEALICLELMRKEVPFDSNWTLGQLIKFCKGKKIGRYTPPKEIKKLFANVIKDLKQINKLRIGAVHLKPEKEASMKIDKWDELVPLEKFKCPPVKMGEEWISGDDVMIVDVKGRMYICYRYKNMAMKAYNHVQNILKSLYKIDFKFRFKNVK